MGYKNFVFANSNSLWFFSGCGKNNCAPYTGLVGKGSAIEERTCFRSPPGWVETFYKKRKDALKFCDSFVDNIEISHVRNTLGLHKPFLEHTLYEGLCPCKCSCMCRNHISWIVLPDCPQDDFVFCLKSHENTAQSFLKKCNSTRGNAATEGRKQTPHHSTAQSSTPSEENFPDKGATSKQPAYLKATTTTSLEPLPQKKSTSVSVESDAHKPTTLHFNTDDISMNITGYGTRQSIQPTSGKSLSGRPNYTSQLVRTSLFVPLSSLSFKSRREMVTASFTLPSIGTSSVAGDPHQYSRRPIETENGFSATSTAFINGNTEENWKSANYLSTLSYIGPEPTSVLTTNSGGTAGENSHTKTYPSIPVDQSTSLESGFTSVQNTPYLSTLTELVKQTPGSTVTTIFSKVSTVPEYYSSQSTTSTESSTATVLPMATTSTNSLRLTKITETVSGEGPLTHSEKSSTSNDLSLLHAASSTDLWRAVEVTSQTNPSHGIVISNEADTAIITALRSNVSEPTPQMGMTTSRLSHPAPITLTRTNAHYENESTEEAVHSGSQEEDSNISVTTESIYNGHSHLQTAKNSRASSTERVATKTTTGQVAQKSWAANSGMETFTETTYELLDPISTTSLSANQLHHRQQSRQWKQLSLTHKQQTKNALDASTEKVATKTTAEQVAKKSSAANSEMETFTDTTYKLLDPISTTSLSAKQIRNYTDVFEHQTMAEAIISAASSSTVTTVETTQPDPQTTTKNALDASTEKVAAKKTAEQVPQKSSAANSEMETFTDTTYKHLDPISTTSLSATQERNYTYIFEHQTMAEAIIAAASSSTVTTVETTQLEQQARTKTALAAPSEKDATITMTERISPKSPVQESSTGAGEKQATHGTARRSQGMTTIPAFATAYFNSTSIPWLIELTIPTATFISGNCLTAQLKEVVSSSSIDEKQTFTPSQESWTNRTDAVESSTANTSSSTMPTLSVAVVTPVNDELQNRTSTSTVEESSVSLSSTVVGDLTPIVSSTTYASTSIAQWISPVKASSGGPNDTISFTASDFHDGTTREEEFSTAQTVMKPSNESSSERSDQLHWTLRDLKML
ncbi:hypothetical protein ANCCEY_12081 [Ancylostoma ceylanicum]|uniref:Uncharacterized protein n=1 Tax=Ancylostoma ceylanicum TaxID=53326 RepID=A0A0D6LC70_9BILA|nr:hypothetical protein ANCCEY_12081 [Ancylostoma ceylanicum]